jgi:hypothetical protein
MAIINIANINDISAIPAGAYPATLRYDHADGWRIELQNVPDRTNVQIHVGNWTSDSHGCILVGTSVSKDLCSLQDSKNAYDALRRAFYAAQVAPPFPDEAIDVEIAGTTTPDQN